MPVQLHHHKITKDDALNWGISYMRRFLRGEFERWEDALEIDGLVNLEAKRYLSWAAMSPKEQKCRNINTLIEMTGYLCPEQLRKWSWAQLAEFELDRTQDL